MPSRAVSRVLLGFAATLLLAGSVIHAAAFFSGVNARLGQSNLSPLLLREIRTLWLTDSSTLAVVALGLVLLAVRPKVPGRAVAWALCAIPAATAILLYFFLGSFFAAHLLLAATVLAAVGIAMAARDETKAPDLAGAKMARSRRD